MPRPIFDQIITANALLEGDVVYFTTADTWTRDICLLYTSPSPRDLSTSRMPSSA